MTNKEAEILIKDIINLAQSRLLELNKEDISKDSCLLGEKTAYVEILELIKKFDQFDFFNLNYPIEKLFPISNLKPKDE